MKMSKRIVILSAVGAVTIGLIIALSIIGSINFNFHALETEHYGTHDTYPIYDEPYDSIDIETLDGNVLIHSGSGRGKVTCNISEHVSYDVISEGGTLKIKQNDSRDWYERMGASSPLYGVVIDLPDKEYQSLRIKTASGNIQIYDRTFAETTLISTDGDIQMIGGKGGKMDVSTVSGEIMLSTLQLDSMKVASTSTDIFCSDVRVAGASEFRSTSGSINLYGFDADSIVAVTESGNIDGIVESSKNFSGKSQRESCTVPPADTSKGVGSFNSIDGKVYIRLDRRDNQ